MTKRQEIEKALRVFGGGGREVNTYVPSGLCSLREKEVYDHLEHVRKSLKNRFVMTPAECAVCGYTFKDRSKVRPPSKCPKCHSEQINPPLFKIIEKTP